MRLFVIRNKDRALEELYDRVAFATRYGGMGYYEAMDVPVDELVLFNAAVGRLLEAENRPPSR
jgi:hypothetical protein